MILEGGCLQLPKTGSVKENARADIPEKWGQNFGSSYFKEAVPPPPPHTHTHSAVCDLGLLLEIDLEQISVEYVTWWQELLTICSKPVSNAEIHCLIPGFSEMSRSSIPVAQIKPTDLRTLSLNWRK